MLRDVFQKCVHQGLFNVTRSVFKPVPKFHAVLSKILVIKKNNHLNPILLLRKHLRLTLLPVNDVIKCVVQLLKLVLSD